MWRIALAGALIIAVGSYSYAAGITAVVLGYIFYKLGLLDSVQVRQDWLGPTRLIYWQHMGSYMNVGSLFNQVYQQTKQIFPNSQLFGCFYDDPKVTSPQNCRGIVGITVHLSQLSKVQAFVADRPGVASAQVQSSRILKCDYPYWNKLSILVYVKRCYPALEAAFPKGFTPRGGIMEIYRLHGRHKFKHVQIIVPMQEADRFYLAK